MIPKALKIIQIGVLSIIFLTIIVVFWSVMFLFYFFGIYTNKDLLHWKDFTTPLPIEVIDDLCTKFNISPTDRLCSHNKPVYGPEFWKIICQEYNPDNPHKLTYDDVQQKLGRYEYNCDPKATLGDGSEYFGCSYDLTGDRIYRFGIYYSGVNEEIFRINMSLGD